MGKKRTGVAENVEENGGMPSAGSLRRKCVRGEVGRGKEMYLSCPGGCEIE